jgi:hypothetical protein
MTPEAFRADVDAHGITATEQPQRIFPGGSQLPASNSAARRAASKPVASPAGAALLSSQSAHFALCAALFWILLFARNATAYGLFAVALALVQGSDPSVAPLP